MVQRTIRKKVKVPLYGQPAGKVAKIEDGATMGATIGSTLYFEDGALVTLANLAIALGVGASSSSGALPLGRTIWNLIQEIPENVVEVAALATSGLVVRQAAGDWITRAIAVADATRLTIADGDGDAGAPTLDMADIAAVSVWGRAANSSGKPAAIAAGANDLLLARTGDALSFQQLTAGMFPAALTLSTNFTLTGTVVAQNAIGLEIENTLPLLLFDETDAAANERQWAIRSATGEFQIVTRDDAGGFGAAAVVIQRNGTSLVEVELNASQFDGNFVNSDFAVSSVATFTTPEANFEGNANSAHRLRLRNASNGASASSQLDVFSNTNQGLSIYARGSGHSSGAGVLLHTRGAYGLELGTNDVTYVTIDSGGTTTLTKVGSGGVTGATLALSSGTPYLALNETDGGTDQKLWRLYASSERLTWDISSDSAANSAAFLSVERSGTAGSMAVDSISLFGASFRAFQTTNITLTSGVNEAPSVIAERSVKILRVTDANLGFFAYNASLSSPSYPSSGQTLGEVRWHGYAESASEFYHSAGILGTATQTWTSTARGTALYFRTTANGAASIAEAGRFSSSGALQVQGQFGGGFASALGVEIGVSSGQGFVQAFNRNTSAYAELVLVGSLIYFNASSTRVAAIGGGIQTTAGHSGMMPGVTHAFMDVNSGTARFGGYHTTNGAQPVAIYASATSLSIANGLTNAANDGAAAAAGVPVTGLYRNGSVVMIRVA